jgi:hypothetical protein
MTLDTPAKVQDYLDTIPMNHEVTDETFLSAVEALRQNQGHCVESAMLGAYILSLHGRPPYLMSMSAYGDLSHVVVPFRDNGQWGCLSASNHQMIRYRNPVYRTIRELMMTYVDDYMNGRGTRSLHAYTLPINLSVVFGQDWATRRGEVWEVGCFHTREYDLVKVEELAKMRPADRMMMATIVPQAMWACPANLSDEAKLRNVDK